MASSDSVNKGEVVKKYQTHKTDTGSPEVQIAVLTKRLELLSKHFEKHMNDKHSQRGMMALISRRKRLLQYLKNEDLNRYRSTISALGLRK
jgi:small subunit ribosomal protein S15